MRRGLPKILLAGTLLAAGCRKAEDPVEAATRQCRYHYDMLMLWISGRGVVPETEEELEAAAKMGENDPWGNGYVLEAVDNQFRVWSWGPDGEEGTEDDICYPRDDAG